jgi:hypothetical protein
MVTESEAVCPLSSLAVSWNVKAPAVAGALKLGVAVFVPERVTSVPAVWTQA